MISMRQPWSSVRCQWKVLSLCVAMASSSVLICSMLWKWRAESSMKPRHEKRGASSMRIAARLTVLDGLPANSCHSDIAP
ncbi:hypothetical protein D3C81_2110160 [compost metagenome]